jgi:integrase
VRELDPDGRREVAGYLAKYATKSTEQAGGLLHRINREQVDHALRAAAGAARRRLDLRHLFVSLLIQDGRTVIDVAGQAGHSAETCLRYYAHLLAEFDPACACRRRRRSDGRVRGRSEDAGPDEAAAA